MSASKLLLFALFAVSAVLPMIAPAQASSPPSVPPSAATGHKYTVYYRYHSSQPWSVYDSYPSVREAINAANHLQKQYKCDTYIR